MIRNLVLFFSLVFISNLSFGQAARYATKELEVINGITYKARPIENYFSLKGVTVAKYFTTDTVASSVSRVGNTIYGLLDDYTGETFTFTKIIDASNVVVDSVIYLQKGNEVFKRDFEGPANVRWFGAIGDGVTNDRLKIQKAFDNYNNILIPKNYTFYIKDTSLFINKRGLVIEGQGTIKQDIQDSLKCVIINKATNTSIRDITIDGHAPNAVAGVYNEGRAGILSYSDSLTITNCTIRKQTCIQSISSNYLTISNCKLIYTQMALHFWGDDYAAVHDLKVLFNTITNDDVLATDDHVRGIRSTNAYNTQIIGNTIMGAQLSIELWNHRPSYATNNVVSNNISDTWISFVSGSATVTGNIIDYSLKPSNGAIPIVGGINQICGIEFTNAYNITCSNNYVANVPGMAIYTATPSGAYNAGLVLRGGVISNNVIYRCGDTIPSHFYMANIGIGSGATDILITGNLLKETRTSGIGVAGVAAHLVNNVQIIGNTIINGSGDGIWNYFSRNVVISNNTVQRQKGNGIIVGAAKTINTVVKNNTTLNNSLYGVWIYANSIGHIVKDNISRGNINGNLRSVNSVGIIGKIYDNENSQVSHFLPEFGSFNKGDFYPTNSDIYAGIRCVTGGTMGTLASTTATTTAGSKIITVNDSLRLTEDDYITIVGVTGVYRVQSTDGFTLTLSAVVDASVSNAAVAYSPASFVNQSFTQFPQYKDMTDPNKRLLAVQGSSYIQDDGVNSIQWFKTTPVNGSGGAMGWMKISPDNFNYGRTFNPSTSFIENLLIYSNNFSNAAWTAQNFTPVFDNTVYAPDSSLGAYKLVESSSYTGKLLFSPNVTKPAKDLDYTLSFYVRSSTRTQVTAMLSTTDLTQHTRANIDISGKGQLGRVDTTDGFRFKNATADKLDNGWYRVSLTTTIPSTITSFRANIYGDSLLYLTPTTPYTGDDVNGYYIYGAQLSQTGYTLPYVETQASAVVRQKINWNNLVTDTSVNSASKATLGQLQKKIDSLQALVVHLSGSETISGAKTLSSLLTTIDLIPTTDNVSLIGTSVKQYQRLWAQIVSSNTQLTLSAANTGINFNVGGTTRATVFTDGNISIGNSPTNDAVNKLQVNGSVKATGFRLSAIQTAPTSATDTGVANEIRFTTTGIYICIATNTWIKATAATF